MINSLCRWGWDIYGQFEGILYTCFVQLTEMLQLHDTKLVKQVKRGITENTSLS